MLGVKYMTLEVRDNNENAIKLYKSFGFTVEGIRKKYYNNVHDALIMWATLSTEVFDTKYRNNLRRKRRKICSNQRTSRVFRAVWKRKRYSIFARLGRIALGLFICRKTPLFQLSSHGFGLCGLWRQSDSERAVHRAEIRRRRLEIDEYLRYRAWNARGTLFRRSRRNGNCRALSERRGKIGAYRLGGDKTSSQTVLLYQNRTS